MITYVLTQAEKLAGAWPTAMPGHVNFGDHAPEVGETLTDGVHRLEGSLWQFVVEGGRIVRGVREDLHAWWLQVDATHFLPLPNTENVALNLPGSDGD